MAKVTVTFEDTKRGTIAVVADPTWRTLIDKHKSGHKLSLAEENALLAINNCLARSKQEGKVIIQDRLKEMGELVKFKQKSK